MKIQMVSIDINSLKDNVSKYTGINKQDLDLISFEVVEKATGKYEVSLEIVIKQYV